ncbi:MAG: CpaD family pilus assembly protein [Pseudomonadota bacterium]
MTNRKQVPVPQPRNGKTGLMTVLILAPAVAMTGCASFSKDHFTVGSVPGNYKTKHPIVIDEKEHTVDIPVARSTYNLSKASASVVEGFAYRSSKAGSGVITVLMPSGSPNEAAARTISNKIVDTLYTSGIQSNRIRMVTYNASRHGPTAPVRLSYNAVSASVKGCGKWTADLGDTKENKNYHNFGCASQNNLAVMVANPADLLGPRGMSETDAARRSTVIQDYREDGSILQGPPPTLYTR